MAGGPAQKCQVSAGGSRSSAPGCVRAAAGALGPARAAQRQPLLQSRLQVWQCGFTLYAPPPPPRPRSSSSAAAFLPPARPLARGRRRLGRAPPLPRPAARERRCWLGPAAGARAHGVGSCGAGPERWTDRLPRCCCPARRRRRGPLAGSLAPSAALTHVLLTEQNPNYSPALPPTSATLSHWAAGLFRRNNKTCQSGEGQRVTETRLGGRGARRATKPAGPGKVGGPGSGGREGTRVARGTRPASACPGSGPHLPAQRAGTRGARPRRASGIAFPCSENRPSGNLLSQKWVSSC